MNKGTTTRGRASAIKPIVDSRVRRRSQRLIKVSDCVYCGHGYSVSNAHYVVTAKSVVVIDTTESICAARASLADFRKAVDLPITTIIYTHFHGDHIRGAKAFYRADMKIIAQKQMPEELARNNMLLPYRERVNGVQLGSPKPAAHNGPLLHDPGDGYVPPNVLFDEEFRFEEGGTEFELFHTQGESVDHVMVWLPRQKTLFPGDLFYSCFPMLSNPLKPDRPVAKWIDSLEQMRRLRPDYLVPSHGTPIQGAEEIDSTLANYANAIRHVYTETVKGINEHLSLWQILERVRLPEELQKLPYLEERYGTVRWAVSGIFRQNTGWYDLNPSHLNPGARVERSRALVNASQGPGPFLARARLGIGRGEWQIVLEMTDIILDVLPHHPRARALRLAALTRLGDVAGNALERNIYRSAAKALSHPAVGES